MATERPPRPRDSISAGDLVRELMRDELHRYPDPDQRELRAEIAGSLHLAPDAILAALAGALEA